MNVGKVLQLPKKPTFGHEAQRGASALDVYWGRAKDLAGRALNALKAPGVVQNADIKDAVTGQHVSIRVEILFTRISVDGRDYYFNRLSGKFDGTGMGCG